MSFDTTTIHTVESLERAVARLGGWRKLDPEGRKSLYLLHSRLMANHREAVSSRRAALAGDTLTVAVAIDVGLRNPAAADDKAKAAAEQWSALSEGVDHQPEDFGGLF